MDETHIYTRDRRHTNRVLKIIWVADKIGGRAGRNLAARTLSWIYPEKH